MYALVKIEEDGGIKKVVDGAVFDDSEADNALQFIRENRDKSGVWICGSSPCGSRGKNARVGDIYDSERCVFIPPKPSSNPSYVFDEKFWRWIPPIPYPKGIKRYRWDELTVSWVEFIPEK